ncbi:uncharacterized protein LOC143186969 [Calliopsis andreniformis]|uniref:uncharacterized protein LOC143186969 n=1 Tax=Calliopsis andreniformis TaxID=337506 RepID=UPI003FCD9522
MPSGSSGPVAIASRDLSPCLPPPLHRPSFLYLFQASPMHPRRFFHAAPSSSCATGTGRQEFAGDMVILQARFYVRKQRPQSAHAPAERAGGRSNRVNRDLNAFLRASLIMCSV